jgi:hypothetical protein
MDCTKCVNTAWAAILWQAGQQQHLCVKPRDPAHGRVLCNSRELAAGSRCILECEAGYLPRDGELAVCQPGGEWSTGSRLACVRPIVMLIGGYNAEEVGGRPAGRAS